MPKMKWCCNDSGCFLDNGHPAIEAFDDCFPGKIGLGDLDGVVEINGKLLLLEWKRYRTDFDPDGGQGIMYRRCTGDGDIAVILVAGDPRTMETSYLAKFWRGRFIDWVEASLGDVKVAIRKWVDWAEDCYFG